MRFLVDQNLSRKVAAALRAAGHDVVHTSEVELSTAADHSIAELAVAEARVVVSADTDFVMLLATSGATSTVDRAGWTRDGRGMEPEVGVGRRIAIP